MKKHLFTFLYLLVLTALFFVGFFLGNTHEEAVFVEKKVSDNSQIQFSGGPIFKEALEIIEEEYIASGEVTDQELERGVIAGYVSALGDPHTEFFPPEVAESFREAISGDFEWIGAYVDDHELGILIERLIAGSPALAAGIQPGDIVIMAGETELYGMSAFEAVEYIKGPAGTPILLTILRDGAEGLLEIEVVREKITVPVVESEFLEDEKIGILRVSSFTGHLYTEFLKFLEELQAQGAEVLIIDLRNNGGGLLEEAVTLLDVFLPSNQELVSIEWSPAVSRKHVSQHSALVDLPLVVLINENSASASEIFAGTLQDYGRGVIVGTQSFGKWSVQQAFTLSDTSELKVTIAHWYTPDHQLIEGNGVTPDYTLDFDYEAYREEEMDNQQDKAIDLAKLLKTRRISEILESLKNRQDEK